MSETEKTRIYFPLFGFYYYKNSLVFKSVFFIGYNKTYTINYVKRY